MTPKAALFGSGNGDPRDDDMANQLPVMQTVPGTRLVREHPPDTHASFLAEFLEPEEVCNFEKAQKTSVSAYAVIARYVTVGPKSSEWARRTSP